MRRAFLLVLAPAALATGCIPDLGGVLASDAADAATADLGGRDGEGESEAESEGGPDGDGPIDPDAGSGGPLCDDSTPSDETDRYVWGENFQFYFTPVPEDADINTLYVPRNALVHFSLAGSTNEEVHIWGIRLAECETVEGGVGLGTEGLESLYDWKAPKVAGTYPFAGYCVNHEGMDFDIVVEP